MWFSIFISSIVLASVIAIVFGHDSLQANIFYGVMVAAGVAYCYFDDTPYDGDSF